MLKILIKQPTLMQHNNRLAWFMNTILKKHNWSKLTIEDCVHSIYVIYSPKHYY